LNLPIAMLVAVSAVSLLPGDDSGSSSADMEQYWKEAASYRMEIPPLTPSLAPASFPEILDGPGLSLAAMSHEMADAQAGHVLSLSGSDPNSFLNQVLFHPASVRVIDDLRWEGLMVPLYRLASGRGSQISTGNAGRPGAAGGHPRARGAHPHDPDVRSLERLLRFQIQW
jgi:hypothetical protein